VQENIKFRTAQDLQHGYNIQTQNEECYRVPCYCTGMGLIVQIMILQWVASGSMGIRRGTKKLDMMSIARTCNFTYRLPVDAPNAQG
jgi:hypothetical protein